MRKRTIFLTVCILGIAALIIYRIQENSRMNGPVSSKKTAALLRVQGSVLKPQVFENNLSLSGTLEANEEIDIRKRSRVVA